MNYEKLIIYTDGGARGNPGPAGIGVILKNEKKRTIAQISEFIGETTNNQAEYKAVIAALKKAKMFGARELVFYLDSELVIKQLNREFKVKDKELAPLFVQVYNSCLDFRKVTFKHVLREQNQEADRLVNQAINNVVRY